jgi:hypothetical protein
MGSLATLLHNVRSVLLILLLRDPHLVESSQTSQDTSSNPGAKASLRGVTGSSDTHSGAREHLHQFVVQTISEAMKQAGSTGHNDISQQVGPEVDVNTGQGSLNKFRDSLRGCRGRERRVGVGNGSLGIEQRFHGAETVDTKDLVVSVGELEWATGGSSSHIFVGNARGTGG